MDRVKYWLGVGAQPSDRVRVLIKKYGPEGTHLKEQEAAVAQFKAPKMVPDAGEPKLFRQAEAGRRSCGHGREHAC